MTCTTHTPNFNSKKLTKYEEVVCKSILAYEMFFKNFLLDTNVVDIRSIVNKMFEKEDFDGQEIIAQLIIKAIYESDSNKEIDFLPTDIEKNVDSKFFIPLSPEV